MGNATNEAIEKAMQGYLKAVVDHDQLIQKHFRLREYKPGESIVVDKLPTKEELTKLDEARAIMNKAWGKVKRLTGL